MQVGCLEARMPRGELWETWDQASVSRDHDEFVLSYSDLDGRVHIALPATNRSNWRSEIFLVARVTERQSSLSALETELSYTRRACLLSEAPCMSGLRRYINPGRTRCNLSITSSPFV